MKYIGLMLVATGSAVLTLNGFGLNTWQWYVITLSYITGQHLLSRGGN